MTTIVAVKDKKGQITFGWDSQVTKGHYKAELSSSKVFRNGQVVMGVSGSLRASNIIEFMDVPEVDSYRPGFDPRRWAITEFIPSLRASLRHNGALETGDVDQWNGALILAVSGDVFEVGLDFAVLNDTTGTIAVGSGSEVARAALLAGASIESAVRQATERDTGSGGIIHVKTVEEFLNDE